MKLAIFMAGYPFAGKSHVVEKLAEILPETPTVISPKDFREDHYNDLDATDKLNHDLAAWEVSLDVLIELLPSDDNVIIYDTACASNNVMLPMMKTAKKDRFVLYVWVDADKSVCKRRSGDAWIGDAVMNKYDMKFDESKPILSKFADGTIVIKNNEDGPVDLEKLEMVISAATYE